MPHQDADLNIESIRLANDHEIKKRELAIAEKRLELEFRGEHGKKWSELKIAIVSILSAMAAALGTLAAAYYGGFFDLQKTYATGNATLSLTKLQFSNELIKTALSSNNPANSLLFYADVGLLDGLKAETVKSYAEKENSRIANNDQGPSLLPKFTDAFKANAALWVTEDLIRAVAPRAKPEIIIPLTTLGNYIISGFEINKNPQRLAMFLAQIAHESAGFTLIDEAPLSYSAEQLVRIWPKQFDEKSAKIYANNPEKILNKVYANKIGNGDESTGDGWRFRGRGLILMTGRSNYKLLSDETGINLIDRPDLASDPNSAILIAAAYWHSRGLNELSDTGDIVNVTRRISSGTVGLNERKKYYDLAFSKLKKGIR